jgi:membrane protease YdiL (CAAX protease family)
MIVLAIYFSVLMAGLATMLIGLGWLALFVYFAGMPLGAIAVWRLLDRPLSTLGYAPYSHQNRHLVLGTIAGLGTIMALFVVLYGVGWANLPSREPDVWQLAIIITIQQVIVAVIEEVTFRGVIQQILTDVLDHKRGWIGASMLFGLFHVPNIVNQNVPTGHIPLTITTLTLMGLVFGWAFQRTNFHLALPIALHFGWNAASFNLEDTLHLSLSGPSWLTGVSTWFPESGVLGFMALIMLALIIRRVKNDETDWDQ